MNIKYLIISILLSMNLSVFADEKLQKWLPELPKKNKSISRYTVQDVLACFYAQSKNTLQKGHPFAKGGLKAIHNKWKGSDSIEDYKKMLHYGINTLEFANESLRSTYSEEEAKSRTYFYKADYFPADESFEFYRCFRNALETVFRIDREKKIQVDLEVLNAQKEKNIWHQRMMLRVIRDNADDRLSVELLSGITIGFQDEAVSDQYYVEEKGSIINYFHHEYYADLVSSYKHYIQPHSDIKIPEKLQKYSDGNRALLKKWLEDNADKIEAKIQLHIKKKR